MISAPLASKKWLNQKLYHTNYVKYLLISILKCLLVFDLSLEARAEIMEIISWVFWEKQSFHNDIIKLTATQLSSDVNWSEFGL